MGRDQTYERRTVRLPRFLCEQVGAYLAGRPHGPGDLVFTMPQSGPLREPKFAERYFKPAARAVGLPAALWVHDLRHTCASLLIREGGEHQGCAAPPGPQVGVDHPGPLRPPVPGGAGPPGRPPGPAARPGWCVPSAYRRPDSCPRTKQRAWSVTRPVWWRWGDSNSRPAASFQGFSERSHRLSFGPGLSGGDAPGS